MSRGEAEAHTDLATISIIAAIFLAKESAVSDDFDIEHAIQFAKHLYSKVYDHSVAATTSPKETP